MRSVLVLYFRVGI
jgi:hypothetical protein